MGHTAKRFNFCLQPVTHVGSLPRPLHLLEGNVVSSVDIDGFVNLTKRALSNLASRMIPNYRSGSEHWNGRGRNGRSHIRRTCVLRVLDSLVQSFPQPLGHPVLVPYYSEQILVA